MSETSEWETRARDLDAQDELRAFRAEFYCAPGMIYMDGNSLGLLSRPAEAALLRALDVWKTHAIAGWTEGPMPWLFLAETLARQTATLLGADSDQVIVTNSTTVNLHQLIATLYESDDARPIILADALNFPSDLYALQSQLRLRGRNPETNLRLVAGRGGLLSEDDIIAAMTPDVQIALLPAVVYASGQLLDMARLSAAARERGILIGFDCSHSIGAAPHELDAWGADFAFWCSYKYLNGGPGASGGLYLNRRHFGRAPGLAGWFGSSRARQFDMRATLDAAPDAAALQIGTPNILSMAPLAGALELFARAGMTRLRRKSLAQTDFLMAYADARLADQGVTVLTPREAERRGGHVALRHPEAMRVCKALRAQNVVPDFRPPDIIRLAPAPLYTSFLDCCRAGEALRDILATRAYTRYSPEREIVS